MLKDREEVRELQRGIRLSLDWYDVKCDKIGYWRKFNDESKVWEIYYRDLKKKKQQRRG